MAKNKPSPNNFVSLCFINENERMNTNTKKKFFIYGIDDTLGGSFSIAFTIGLLISAMDDPIYILM